jgi:hypothetical protein
MEAWRRQRQPGCLDDKEEVTATNAFWRGIKTLFREKVPQPFDPIVEAFEILEPLLIAVNPDLLRSATFRLRSIYASGIRDLRVLLVREKREFHA